MADWFENNKTEIEALANDPLIKKLNSEINEIRSRSQENINKLSDKTRQDLLSRLSDPS